MIQLNFKNIVLLIQFILVVFPMISPAQNTKLSCIDFRKGIFYTYPKNSADHYVTTRDNEYSHETNTSTGDTTLWKVKWLSDCVYSLKYISGNAKIADENLAVLKKHTLVFEMSAVTNDYYVFTGHIDKASNIQIQTDTMWTSEKVNVANNELFKPISFSSFKKPADTARYSILYIYRPGKITNSMANYLIYFDDNFMCVAKNNSGYVFKIFKEGKFEVKSKLYSDQADTQLDVKFGNIYFVKSMIHWTLSDIRYNFKLDMAVVNADLGKDEFDKVKVQ